MVLIGALACRPSAPPPALTPTPQPSPTPEPLPTPAPALTPTPRTQPQGLLDLSWTSRPPTLEVLPLAPIVGDKLHVNIKQTWINTGLVAPSSGFNIRLEIRRANLRVFAQDIKVPQPVERWEEHTLGVTPEYVILEPGSYEMVLTLDPEEVIAEIREDNNVKKLIS